MTQNVKDENLGVLARRFNELFSRVQRGKLPVKEVLRAMQAMIEGKFGSLETRLPYADEQCEPDWTLSEVGVLSLDEQIAFYKEHFPDLDSSHIKSLAQGDLGHGMQGWVAIPKVEGDYAAAVLKALDFLVNHHDLELDLVRNDALVNERVQLIYKTKYALGRMNKQPGDFWVFQAQFGEKWAGHSLRNAQERYYREEFTAKNMKPKEEFGLGPYETAMILAMHPALLKSHETFHCSLLYFCPIEHIGWANGFDGNISLSLQFGKLSIGYYRQNANRWDTTMTGILMNQVHSM